MHAPGRVLVSVCIFVILLTAITPLLDQVRSATSTASRTSGSLTEWTVPTPDSGPWALTLGQDGLCCWFLEYYANKVGHLDPVSGVFQEWTIPTAGANPYDLAFTTISNSTVLWGTEFSTDRIFAFWPELGVFREYPLPYPTGKGVGYVSVEPTTGPEARVWFTETTQNRNGELVYDPATSNVTLYEDQFPAAAGGGAYGVYAISNAVWFAGFSALIRWDRASQQYTMWPLPNHGPAIGRFISIDASGQVWYTQGLINGTSNRNYVGVLRGGSFIEEWQIPTLGADLAGIGINRFTEQPWVVERSTEGGNGGVAVLDNSTGGRLVSTPVMTAPSGGTAVTIAPQSSVSSASVQAVTPVTSSISGYPKGPYSEYTFGPALPRDVVIDSEGNVWTTEPVSNKIVRLSGFQSDYSLAVTPPYLTLPRTASGTITVTGTSISGYAGPIALTTAGLPRGVTLSAFPYALNIPTDGHASLNVTINAGPNATNGPSIITIIGSNGSVEHSASMILVITNMTTRVPSPTSQCLIATATFGSDLNSQVQALRDLRDNQIQRSKVGSAFMIVFNAWYYSFSPYVASYVSDHSVVRFVMRGILYPLIGSLYLASALYAEFSWNAELATVLSGLVASFLIGAFYMGLILVPVERVRRRFDNGVGWLMLLSGLCGILVGELMGNAQILMVTSSLVVMSAVWSSATLTAKGITRVIGRCRLSLKQPDKGISS